MKNITIALVLLASPVMAQESIRMYNPPVGAVGVLKSGDTMTGPLTLSDSSLTVTATAGNFVVVNSSVGIRTTSPTAALDVVGEIKSDLNIVAPTVRANTRFNGNQLSNTLSVNNATLYVENTGLRLYTNTTTGIAATIDSANASGTGNLLTIRRAGDVKAVVLNDGSVGIGTTAPASTLQIGTSLDGTTNYLQIDTLAADTAGPPAATDCDAATEVGRMVLSSRYTATADNMIWVCLQTAASTYAWWKTALTAP